jgi:hypothetical protein
MNIVQLKNIVWQNGEGPNEYELEIDPDYVDEMLTYNGEIEHDDVITQIVYEDLPAVCDIPDEVISFDWSWK